MVRAAWKKRKKGYVIDLLQKGMLYSGTVCMSEYSNSTAQSDSL